MTGGPGAYAAGGGGDGDGGVAVVEVAVAALAEQDAVVDIGEPAVGPVEPVRLGLLSVGIPQCRPRARNEFSQ